MLVFRLGISLISDLKIGKIRVRETEREKDKNEIRTFRGVGGKAFPDAFRDAFPNKRRPSLTCLLVSVPRILAEEEEGGECSWFPAADSNTSESYTSQPSSSTTGAFWMAWDVFLSNSSRDIW